MFGLCEQAFAESKINEITIEGNNRIAKDTILSYLTVKRGDTYSLAKAAEVTKDLFGTGFFEDVDVILTPRGALSIKVKEYPMIVKIAFEGIGSLKKKDALAEMELKERAIYSPSKLKRDIDRLLLLYQKQGRYAVDIKPKLIKLDENRINLILEIQAGHKAKIKKINFTGNNSFSAGELRRIINSKETAIWFIFSNADIYDVDKSNLDQELLKEHYLNSGYADFKVVSSFAELAPSREHFIITHNLEEGPLYKFGGFKVISHVPGVEPAELEKLVKASIGNKFNQSLLDETTEAMVNKLGDNGYAFVDIDTEFDRDRNNNTIGVRFIVNKSQKVYINKINIKNNVRTLDKVIRRELKISEGDPYNRTLIARSRQKVTNLDFFKRVELKNKRTKYSDKMDLDIEVEEKPTGSITLQAGYNTDRGIFGTVGISEDNWLGRGQEISAEYTQGRRERGVLFSFTEPYFLDKELSAGIDLFMDSEDRSSERSYKEARQGFALRTGYNLSEHLTHSIDYTFANEVLNGILDLKKKRLAATAASGITNSKEKKKYVVSSASHGLTYDKLDNRYHPTSGYILRFTQSYAGLGGNVKYIRNMFVAKTYYPVYKDDVILGFSGHMGYIRPLGGKELRLNDRFFIGGAQKYLRGFESSGIGPRDKRDGDAIGGKQYYAASAEVTFPIGLPRDLGFKGSVFTDIATLHGAKVPVGEQQYIQGYGSKKLRVSYGAGIVWDSPFGKLRFDYAIAARKEKHDETERFQFSFGTGTSF
jgi:outer membrane protein insertion porin family